VDAAIWARTGCGSGGIVVRSRPVNAPSLRFPLAAEQ
jgi:hypothetical protein